MLRISSISFAYKCRGRMNANKYIELVKFIYTLQLHIFNYSGVNIISIKNHCSILQYPRKLK